MTPQPKKTKAALTWAAIVCALVAIPLALPRAQDVAPGSLAPGDHHRWMAELFSQRPAAMDQSLARFIFPGTHDSGTFAMTVDAACEGCRNSDLFTETPTSCIDKLPDAFEGVCELIRVSMGAYGINWSTAQRMTIGQQLSAGARYFDLRFYRATADDEARTEGRVRAGRFYAHHGLTGPESTQMLDDIAAFLADPSNSQEVLLLAFSQMQEGDGSMSTESEEVFFNRLRTRFGNKMARKQTDACAADLDANCTATERFGDATTIREVLQQGSQVIVSYSGLDAPDLWPTIEVSASFDLDSVNDDIGSGYPTPDNEYYPWRNDAELHRIHNDISTLRDEDGPNKMWGLGLEIGADDAGTALWRGPLCDSADPGNITGFCDAVANDWDAFGTLEDAANWINPKAIPAVVGLRRDRVNIIRIDHYPPMFTEEIFKLNLGATRVRYQIERVTQYDRLDETTDPDYYPVWFFTNSLPTLLQTSIQRYNEITDNADVHTNWPAWKAYPNTWDTAEVIFGIMDSDGGSDDDQSPIQVPAPPFPRGTNPHFVVEQLPISGCVQNAASCLRMQDPQVTSGAPLANSSRVEFRRSTCVWSWLPGDHIDPASLCGEALPVMDVRDLSRVEGTGGSTTFGFDVVLSAPSPTTVTVAYGTSDSTATPGVDYTEVSGGIVTFAPGETRQTVKVYVNGDTRVESTETFTVKLSEPSGATIGDGVATGTIQDDDVHALTVSGESRNEGDAGVTQFTFSVQLSDTSSDPVTVHVRTTNGTATAGSDYTAVPDTLLTFAPGETLESVIVAVNGDHTVEANETFFVTLGEAEGATIAATGGEAAGTIVNDDIPATLTGPGPQSGNEGDAVTFNLGTLTDGRPAGPWSLQVNWGDGATSSSSVGAPGALSGNHLFKDNGSYTVTVSASDVDGVVSNTVTFTATIANVNPTASLGNNGPIDEGGMVTVRFTDQADPSSVDAAAGFHYAYSCANGSLASATYAASGASPTVTCGFNDNGPRDVRARIIDKDNGFTEYTTTVIVDNVAPTATLSNNGPVAEGSAATITFSNQQDPSTADTTIGFHYAFSCTNESLAAATYATGSNLPTTSCTFASDGPHTVRARIFDKDNGAREYTTIVTVTDVPPSLTTVPGQSGVEGASVAFSLGTLADAGADSPWTITVDWGDTHVESYPVTAVGPLTRSHVYADNGVYTVTVSARDKDTVASNAVTFAATIANVAPTITAVGSTIDENGVATVSGTIADPGILDTFVITVAWGDGTSSPQAFAAGTTSYAVTHRYLDDNPTGTPSDAVTVTVAVVDKDGAAGGGGTAVTVRNVPPQVSSLLLEDETGAAIGDPLLALSGLPVDLEAAFADGGTLDIHQSSINWGDGTSGAGSVTESSGTGTLNARHTWSTVGTFTVGVAVTDDDTGVGTRQATIVVTDAKGAVCGLTRLITPMLSDSSVNLSTGSALTQLLGQIQGNIFDARAANGACDMFAKNNYVAAVVKLAQAVQTIEGLIAGGGLTAAQVDVLRQVETRLILAAKWTALTLWRTTTDAEKLAAAASLAERADAASASRDYVSAIGEWLAAVRLLAPTT